MDLGIDVIILAAGLGTRMKSRRAKVLHRAGGLALVEHVVDAASNLTPSERITVVAGHQADEVKSLLAPRGIHFALQAEQKGTGHAVLMCRPAAPADAAPSDYVLILYGDCPLLRASTLRQLVDRQVNSNAAATLIATRLDDPSGYGRVILGEHGEVLEIVEEKAATPAQRKIDLINSGIYCFRSNLLWKHIGEIRPDNPASEYYLTDMAGILTRAGYAAGCLEIADSCQLLGINTRMELAAADRIFRERKANEVMRDGVTIEKPETVTIDCQARIGMDTVIEPFARILGNTRIGEDCRIGACSIVQDSQLADRVAIGPFTVVAESRVGAGASVGPFARLRAGNEVGAGAHIGNFVELKKTRLGAGVKAGHLAYLGDSEIGDATNIGAGTITCNYDGERKHRTKIGKEAFIGSNSTLVAPIEIGDQSYIGAGSVITTAVPPGTLAVGRGRQVNKEGWVARRKARKKTTASSGEAS
jgi:bifunctional UDP-N-acetylglucosamine pyrophosphorylase/glucosamine-1-phosphate N-acetyltransferase